MKNDNIVDIRVSKKYKRKSQIKIDRMIKILIMIVVVIVIIIQLSNNNGSTLWLLAIFSIIIIPLIIQAKKNEEIRNNILNKTFVYYTDFEKNWIISKQGNKAMSGYKCLDVPGCYVILIFDHLVRDNKYSGYQNIYIGQSVNMCKRVHNHFNGKGNGDVYADIKYGKYVYVQFYPCGKNELNKIEKNLIAAFHAKSSYNMTSGGSKISR